jgi:hypothetical protein
VLPRRDRDKRAVSKTPEEGGRQVKDTDIIAAIAPDAVSLMDKAIAEIKRLRQENATLTAERDEARQEVCFLLSRNVTQGCDGDTPEFHATARGWCYLLEEDDE